jgi:hypothetical protein
MPRGLSHRQIDATGAIFSLSRSRFSTTRRSPMRFLIVSAVAAVVLSATQAGAQVSDSTTTSALAGPTPVTLQDFAGSLGVGVPSGRLVRAPSPSVAALFQRLVAMRQRAALDVRSSAAPAGADVPACPMPVARVDSAVLASMPVVLPSVESPLAGHIKGCENLQLPR